MEKKYDVRGMTCSTCVANVTKAVERLDGVSNANVNLMTNSMKVNFDENKIDDEEIIRAVEKIGYGASPAGEKIKSEDAPVDERERALKHRLISSSIFMLILMYIAMGPMVHLPTPRIFHGREGAVIFAFS